MKKKSWHLFGPFLAAFVLLGALLISPLAPKLLNRTQIFQASTSMSADVIKGNAVKNQAFADKEYVPFFGSSELSRISAFHPSTLALKYKRPYVPFLLGAPGTQSMTHYLMLQSMGKELTGKKIVFVISPQWFVPEGVTSMYFDRYFSKQQAYQWLFNLQKIEEADRYFAQRLLKYDVVRKDVLLTGMLHRVSQNQLPTSLQYGYLKLANRFYENEDAMFAGLDIKGKEQKVDQAMKTLPNKYNYQQLDKLAYQQGEKRVGKTPFMIDRRFFNRKVKPDLVNLRGAQQTFDYRYSPEYSDFELVLQAMAKYQIEPLFIIPPVNKQWSDYTGLSQQMLKECAEKITYQLKSQGFENVVDFTDQAATPYFLQDTIHLGWRGWLASDQYIQPFLMSKKQPVKYHLDNRFFSKDWQQAKVNEMVLPNPNK